LLLIVLICTPTSGSKQSATNDTAKTTS